MRIDSSLATGAKVSPKSKPSTRENPFATSLTLLRITTLCSSCLFRKTHLVPMMFLSFGGASRTQTSLRVKLFNSSCMAITQSEFSSASSMLVGSIQETNEYVDQLDDPWRFDHASLAVHVWMFV